MACANIGEANADIAGIGVSIFHTSRGQASWPVPVISTEAEVGCDSVCFPGYS